MIRSISALLALMSLAVSPVGAEQPAPFADFSAKRIKAPKAGSKPVIDIQIDPAEQSAALQPPPPPTAESGAAPASPGRYGWFWAKVSPEMAMSGPGRLDVAMSTLAGATAKVNAPRMQQMQDIASGHGIDILRATVGTQVSPALVLAVIAVESSGQTDAVSGAGAQGLMQLMPDTAARFGVEDSMQPPQNIAGGVKYLNWLMDEFERDPILVLAGYNAGEGSVRKYEGVPPFAETRDYVPKVLAAFQVAKGLCLTPPELITDGCVFASLN